MTDEPAFQNDAVSAEPAPQPASSKITYLPSGDSITFLVPRTGVKGVAVFFLMFSLIWNSITWIITIVLIFSFFSSPSWENVLPMLFLLIFIAIGAAMFLAFLQTAYRKAVIVATASSLVVNQQGPVLNREFQWPREELKTVTTDYSGTTINGRRLKELRIELVSGAHKGFFDGRDDDELAWLAEMLRYYYHL
jgi:hypothetical protein